MKESVVTDSPVPPGPVSEFHNLKSTTTNINDPFIIYNPQISAAHYYARDESGQANFGYAHPGQISENFRDSTGNQIGSWAFFNPEGKEIRVAYVADSQGFRVFSNELPVAPVDVTETPEVAAARAEHLAVHAALESRLVSESTDSSRYSQDYYGEIPTRQEYPNYFEETPLLRARKMASNGASTRS